MTLKWLRTTTARRQRGITIIEMIVASVIVSVAIMGLMSAWAFSFTITQSTDEFGAAESLARQAVERQHALGFLYAQSETQFFDANLAPTNAASARYRVVTTVTSEANAPGWYLNLDHVDVAVYRQSDGAALGRTQTFLSIGGV